MPSVVAKLYNQTGTQLAELPDFADVTIQDKLNDENAWKMNYDRGGRGFSQMIQDSDLAVKFFIDGNQVFEGVIEEDSWDESIESSAVTVAGRSWAGQFEFAKVYPKGGVAAKPAEWGFTNATPGKIFIDLLNAAQARGTVTNLSVGFSATVDSNGQTWAPTSNLTIAYKAGASLLDILKNFGAMGLADWRMSGKTLLMYNPRTFLGVQSGATFRRGRDIKTAPRSRSRRKLGTVYLVGGDENITVERTDASAVAARGRKEQFISQGGIQDTGTLSVVGDLNLTVFSNNRLSKTHTLVFDSSVAAQPKPWLDYLPGEYVDTDLTGTTENYRLVAMSVTMGSDGFLNGEVTLNDVFQEREILLDDALAILTGGSHGAGASTTPGTNTKDTTVPSAPTGLAGASAVYISGRGVQFAQATLNWTAVTTNTTGSVIDDFDRYEINWWYTDEPTLVRVASSSDNVLYMSGLTPAKEMNFKVRAWDSNSHASAWSSTCTFTLDSDTTPPPVPSTPTVANYLGLLRVTWDGLGSAGESMPLDFRYTEVWYSTVNNFTPGDVGSVRTDTLSGKGSANVSGLVYGTTYYAKLISVDERDNHSVASAQGSATPAQVVQTDIGNNVIDFSNVRFKDVGNLVPDGSFELATTAALINTAQFDVVTNPLGATVAPSPKVLRCKTGTATYTVTSGISVSSDESYAMIYSFMGVGLAGADTVVLRLHFTKRDGTTQDVDYKTFNSTTNGASFTLRQAVYNTVPANAVTMDVQVVNTIVTGGAFLYLDEWEVRQQAGTVLIQDLAVSSAKIALLAVGDAQIGSMSAGKITVGTLTADITVSARIKTANTGARAEVNSSGVVGYNASNVQTFLLSATTGLVTGTGTFSSGTVGGDMVKMSAIGPWSDPGLWFDQPSKAWGFNPTVYSSVTDGSLRLISAELVQNSSGRSQLWLFRDHFDMTVENANPATALDSTVVSGADLSLRSGSAREIELVAGGATSGTMGNIMLFGKATTGFSPNTFQHIFQMVLSGVSAAGVTASGSVTWGPTWARGNPITSCSIQRSSGACTAWINAISSTATGVGAYSIAAGANAVTVNLVGWQF